MVFSQGSSNNKIAPDWSKAILVKATISGERFTCPSDGYIVSQVRKFSTNYTGRARDDGGWFYESNNG